MMPHRHFCHDAPKMRRVDRHFWEISYEIFRGWRNNCFWSVAVYDIIDCRESKETRFGPNRVAADMEAIKILIFFGHISLQTGSKVRFDLRFGNHDLDYLHIWAFDMSEGLMMMSKWNYLLFVIPNQWTLWKAVKFASTKTRMPICQCSSILFFNFLFSWTTRPLRNRSAVACGIHVAKLFRIRYLKDNLSRMQFTK